MFYFGYGSFTNFLFVLKLVLMKHVKLRLPKLFDLFYLLKEYFISIVLTVIKNFFFQNYLVKEDLSLYKDY